MPSIGATGIDSIGHATGAPQPLAHSVSDSNGGVAMTLGLRSNQDRVGWHDL